MSTFYTKEQVDAQATKVGQAIKAAKAAGVQVTQVTGQSTSLAVSQKLFTDEKVSTGNKVAALETANGTFKNIKDNVTLSMWVGTQTELDAIAVKDAAVIYMVKS